MSQQFIGPGALERKKEREAKCLTFLESIARGDIAQVRSTLNRSGSKVLAHNGFTLTHAIYSGQPEIAALLIPWVDPTAHEGLALTAAAEKGYLALVQVLAPLMKPAALNDALLMAVTAGHEDVVHFLLRQPGLTVSDGRALAQAFANDQESLVSLLLPLTPLEAAFNLALDDDDWETVEHLCAHVPDDQVQAALAQAPRHQLKAVRARQEAHDLSASLPLTEGAVRHRL